MNVPLSLISTVLQIMDISSVSVVEWMDAAGRGD
jgi:hypothetical protein